MEKHKEKFRSRVSTGWHNLVKPAQQMIRFILEKTQELGIDCEMHTVESLEYQERSHWGPEDECDNDNSSDPELLLGGGVEIYRHEMIQLAVRPLGNLFC